MVGVEIKPRTTKLFLVYIRTFVVKIKPRTIKTFLFYTRTFVVEIEPRTTNFFLAYIRTFVVEIKLRTIVMFKFKTRPTSKIVLIWPWWTKRPKGEVKSVENQPKINS